MADPSTRKLTLFKQLVQADENDYTWQHLQDGYKGVLIGQNDRGLKQRWLLVHYCAS
jgi:hypothetical protein